MSRMNRRRALGWLGLGACGRWSVAASPLQQIPEAANGKGDDPNGGHLPPRILARDRGETRYLAVAFSSDGSRIATAEHAPNFYISVDMESVLRPEGPFLVETYGRGPSVRVWDAATGRSIQPPIEYPSYLLGVALSPDGSRVAAAGGLKYVPNPPDILRRFREAARSGKPVGMRGRSPFWVGSGGGAVRTADVAENREWLTLAPRPTTVSAVTWGTRFIAAIDLEDVLTLWKSGQQEPFLTIDNLKRKGQESRILWLGWYFAFNADGTRAVARSNDPKDMSDQVNVLKVWDASRGRGREMRIGRHNVGSVWSVALNGQGDLLATGTHKGEIILWDFDRLTVVRRCGPPVGKGAAFLAFSPDGKRIASGEPGGAVCLWDIATRRLLRRRYQGPPGDVRALAFLKDTLRVATVSPIIPAGKTEKDVPAAGPEQLRVWDVALD